MNNRRKFLKTAIIGTAGLAIGINGIAEALSDAEKNTAPDSNGRATGFDQDPLPYKYDALEDVIDAMTMEIHYSKHAATYCKNLKEAAQAEGVNMQQSIETLLSNISKYSVKLRNNGGGHFNHEMFWKCMKPKSENNKPSGLLIKAIEDNFGSFENFKTQFSDAGKTRFGSGWVWLYLDSAKKLKVGSTSNQDNPLMDITTVEHKGAPLLCLDVWEHAYYLKYQNKRADYIENWWKVINWTYVEGRYNAAK